MKTIMNLSAAAAFSLVAAFSTGASAQMPLVACATPLGVFPMPGGIPQQGLPCFGPAGPGTTVIMGGGKPSGFPGGVLGMTSGIPGGVPGNMPGGFPGRGQIAGALGGNREMQLAAECSSAGHPKAVAACIAVRLTQAEIEKCKQGIGTSDGCFGPNNTLRIHLENAVSDLTRGPGRSNDLVGRDGFTCKQMGICF